MTVSVIIVAGGKGVRMKHSIRKQYLMLGGRPILSHTLQAFTKCKRCNQIILVIPSGDAGYCKTDVLPWVNNAEKVKMVSGGAKRQDSAYCGLQAVENQDGIVLIHDGVRPFVEIDQIRELILCAEKNGACIPGIPAFDTIKKVNNKGQIEATVDRDGIYLAQTPQAFQYSLIRKAHDTARDQGYLGTDDASLVERLGLSVNVILGDRDNIKITTRKDLRFANGVLASTD